MYAALLFCLASGGLTLSSTEKFCHEYVLNGTSKFVMYVGGNIFINYIIYMDKNILISFMIYGHYVLVTLQGLC